MKVLWQSLHVIFSVLTRHWQQAKAKVYRRNSVEVLSRAVRAPGVIGDVEEAVLFTVGELSPRSPRGPPSHTLADGSSRRTLRDGNARPSHEPWSEEELPTARSQELNTAQLRIAVNCNVHVERKQGTFSGLMWPGQAARSEAGLGQMILAEPTGASLSCHQPLVPIHGEEGVVQRGGEGEARRAREEPLGTRLCAGIRSWM